MGGVDNLANKASQLHNEIAGIGKFFGLASSGMHPFRIYHLPRRRPGSYLNGNGWRAFVVRGGRVMETDALGTDGVNEKTDYDIFPSPPDDPATAFTNEIIALKETDKFHWWLEVGSDAGVTTAQVRWGDDPTVTDYSDIDFPSQNWSTLSPWDNFPKPDSGHIPIGYVNTNSYKDQHIAVIRQYLRSDVIAALGEVCPFG